jgi:hypothetical protein
MNAAAATFAVVWLAASASASSTLDLNLTTGDNGAEVQLTADIRDGLHALFTLSSAGVSGTARIAVGHSVITIDKPAHQPLRLGVAGLALAPSAKNLEAGDQKLIASTVAVAALPSLGIVTDIGTVASGVADGVANWTRAIIPFLIIGLILIVLLPTLPGTVRGTALQAPWARLGIGLVILVAVPSAAVGLLVGGIFLGVWWLGFMMLGLYGLALAGGYTLTGMVVGRVVLDWLGGYRLHVFWTLLGGLAILSLLSLVPYVGALVAIVAMTYGVGALAFAPRTPIATVGSAAAQQRLHLPTIRIRRRSAAPAATSTLPVLSETPDAELVGQRGSAGQVEVLPRP